MKVIDPGHVYALRILDGGDPPGVERLRFVKREGLGYPGNTGHHPGTTTQEVLRALIDRSEYVNGQIPCVETEAATNLMRAALLLLEMRAARRHGRELALETYEQLEDAPLCVKCGHAGCDGRCHP